MNEIIFCITKKCIFNNQKIETFNGIGDIINGLASTFLICQQNNIPLKVLCPDTALNQLLKLPNENFEVDESDIIYIPGDKLFSFLQSNKNCFNKLFLFTNGFNVSQYINEDLKKFLRNIFFSNIIVNNYVKKYQHINNVMHFRFGDDQMVDHSFLNSYYKKPFYPHTANDWNNLIDNESKYDFALSVFNDSIKNFDYVCSDHYAFKKKVKELFPKIEIIDKKPQHISKASDVNGLYFCFVEMTIILHAKNILSLCSFPFGDRSSMFSYWPCLLGCSNFQNYIYNYSENSIYKDMSSFCSQSYELKF